MRSRPPKMSYLEPIAQRAGQKTKPRATARPADMRHFKDYKEKRGKDEETHTKNSSNPCKKKISNLFLPVPPPTPVCQRSEGEQANGNRCSGGAGGTKSKKRRTKRSGKMTLLQASERDAAIATLRASIMSKAQVKKPATTTIKCGPHYQQQAEKAVALMANRAKKYRPPMYNAMSPKSATKKRIAKKAAAISHATTDAMLAAIQSYSHSIQPAVNAAKTGAEQATTSAGPKRARSVKINAPPKTRTAKVTRVTAMPMAAPKVQWPANSAFVSKRCPCHDASANAVAARKTYINQLKPLLQPHAYAQY